MTVAPLSQEQRDAIRDHMIDSLHHTVGTLDGTAGDTTKIITAAAAQILATQLRQRGETRADTLKEVLAMFDKIFPPDLPTGDNSKVRKLRA